MPDDTNHDDNDDTHVIAHEGVYTKDGQIVEPARYYHNERETCDMLGFEINDTDFERWRDHDGMLAVRRVEAGGSSVGGGSRAYNRGYDSIDWGN